MEMIMTKQELLSKHAKQRENLQKKFEKLDKQQIEIWNNAIEFLKSKKSRHKNKDITLHYDQIIRAVQRYTNAEGFNDDNHRAWDIVDDYWAHKFSVEELTEKKAKLLERQAKEAAKFVSEPVPFEIALDDDEVIDSLSAGQVTLVMFLVALAAALFIATSH